MQLLADLKARGLEPPVTQLSSSAAVLDGRASPDCTAVCVGHALYGLRVTDPPAKLPDGLELLRSVLRAVKARLIHVFEYGPAGADDEGGALAGGYGVVRRAEGGRVGVLPLGLGDGARPAVPGAQPYALLADVRSSLPIMILPRELTVACCCRGCGG